MQRIVVLRALVAVALCVSLSSVVKAEECEFDTMVGVKFGGMGINNFELPYAYFPNLAEQPHRDGSLPCELSVSLNSTSPAYIQNTKVEPSPSYWDRFVFTGFRQSPGSRGVAGQAIVRRYEFFQMASADVARHLSFHLKGDAQGAFLTISQSLTATQPAGIDRKLPAGTTVTLTIAPGSGQTSQISIEFVNANAEPLGTPIVFSTPMPVQVAKVKRGNVVPMNFRGDGVLFMAF